MSLTTKHGYFPRKSEGGGKMAAYGVTMVLLSRLFILRRNCTDLCLNCDLNRLQRRSLLQ